MKATIGQLAGKVEQVSQLYAQRCGIRRDDDWYVLKLQEEAGELTAEYLKSSGRGRAGDRSGADLRAALEDEAADLFAQFLLFCGHNAIDLEAALERKWFSHLDTAKGQK